MTYILSLIFLSLVVQCKKETPPEPEWFKEKSQEVNLKFTHVSGTTQSYHIREPMGSGVAVLDCNNDGLLDIFLLNGSLDNTGSEKNSAHSNELFEKQKDGTYKNITESSGLSHYQFSMGAAIGDLNNDGLVDIYLSNYEEDLLYLNEGNCKFKDITSSSGIKNMKWAASAIFFDYDLDGYLDIFVTNYGVPDTSQKCEDLSGRQDFCGPATIQGVPDKLFHNNQNATFTDVSQEVGLHAGPSRGLGVVSADFNGDNLLDLYVANDLKPNQLWLQQLGDESKPTGTRTFIDKALELGVAVNSLGNSEAGMGIAMGDIDGDTDLDLFITHMLFETNTLYLNSGIAGFKDDTYIRGLGLGSHPYTGFGNGFADIDFDGDLDAILVNGRVGRHRLLTQNSRFWDWYSEPNLMYLNQGEGHFENISQSTGIFHSQIESSKGLAIADIDNDGDLDFVINNTGGPARLIENNFPKKGNWISLDPRDKAMQRTLYGAVITLTTNSGVQTRVCQPGYGYLSSHDHRVFFGIPSGQKITSINITWPAGEQETFNIPSMNKHHTLFRGEGKKI